MPPSVCQLCPHVGYPHGFKMAAAAPGVTYKQDNDFCLDLCEVCCGIVHTHLLLNNSSLQIMVNKEILVLLSYLRFSMGDGITKFGLNHPGSISYS